MSKIRHLALWLLLASPALAQTFGGFNGQCAKGGQNVLVHNTPSSGTQPIGGGATATTAGVIASYPRCTVTVFLTGTTTPANLFRDIGGTQGLANPFTANTDGSYLFFAATGQGYDVSMSGVGMPAIVTLTDIVVGIPPTQSPGQGIQLATNGIPNGSQTILNLQNGPNASLTDNGNGTVTVSITGVLTGTTANGFLQQTGTTVGLPPCGVNQVPLYNGTFWLCSSNVGGPTLQTNGTLNGLQSLLNLQAGTNTSIVDSDNGTVTISIANLGIQTASQFSTAYYSQAGTAATIAGIPAPTSPNTVPEQYISTPSGGLGTQPVWALAGVTPRASTCPSNVDTVLATDRTGWVTWNDASSCAVTLPQAGSTNFGSNFVFRGCNIGAGTVTITPTTSTISYTTGSSYVSGASNIALTTGQCATIGSDNTNYIASSATNPGACATCTLTIAHGTSALGTSAISSGTCATVVTTSASGTVTTDNIQADFNADPTSTTGYQPSSNGMLTIIKYPTSNNVNFKVCNNTASSVTPGAVTLNWRVVR